MPEIVSFDELKRLAPTGSIIVRAGYLGDIIACEPVIDHLKDQMGQQIVAWAVMPQYADILRHHPRLDYLVLVHDHNQALAGAENLARHTWNVVNLYFQLDSCLSHEYQYAERARPDINFHNYYDYGSLMQSMALSAGLPLIEAGPRFYIDPQVPISPFPWPYVVFHCLSREVWRNWDPVKWRMLFDYFAGLGIHVVEIGQQNVIETNSPFFCNQTHVDSIQKIAGIIAGASFFFGIDSGFGHLANALEMNGLIIAGRYGNWERYMPFTGYYRKGHMIRCLNLPPYYLPVQKVIDRYHQVSDNSDGDYEAEPPVAIFDGSASDQFPNRAQKRLLKIYQPFVKILAPRFDYGLYKHKTDCFFIKPESSCPGVGLVRKILRIFGWVPTALDDYQISCD